MATTQTKSMSAEEKHAAGVHLLGERRAQEASVLLEEAFHDAPSSERANDWGVAESLGGRAAAAERIFTQALVMNADNFDAALNLGVLLASRRRWREAVPLLEKAIDRIGEDQHALAAELLKRCRTQVVAAAVRESRAAFRDFVDNATANPAPEAGDALVKYWYPDITGWFSRADALHIYTAIKLMRPRRILEIGTFYGRSTATICAAIQTLGTPIDFITIDLDFRSEEHARRVFSEIHGIEKVSVPKQFMEAFDLGFSTSEYAEYRVRKHGLEKYVTFESGDFRDLPGEFDFVFADAMHDKAEIEKNLPAILRMLSPDGTLAVHDLNAQNKQVIEGASDAIEFISNSETLGIFRVNGKVSQ